MPDPNLVLDVTDPADGAAVDGLDDVPKTYDAAVLSLARAHAAGDDAITIYSLPDARREVVRLIEVSDAFPRAGVERPVAPDGKEWVVPVFPMGRSHDFPFRSEIAQVKWDEWSSLQSGQLVLTRDWNLDEVEEVAIGD